MRNYRLESDLVIDFVSSLSNPGLQKWGSLSVATEFNYVRGRTDVIAVNHAEQIIAFEAKLTRWRDALHQAYRNTCFAHFSYIVVPEKVAMYAIQFSDAFCRRSVGICYLSNNHICVPIEATYCTPLQDWLTARAITSALEMNRVPGVH